MTHFNSDSVAVILLGMGGPEKIDDIRQYLFNIFSDRSIIQLPGGRLFQKAFATLLSSRRYKGVQSNYELIGGSSPLYKWTRTQADHIEKLLGNNSFNLKCFIGMRYWKPFIGEVIEEAYKEGYRRICFLPMYPQYSSATTGSSFDVARNVMQGYPDLSAAFIENFYADEGYIDLLRKYIRSNISASDTLMFSAHSLPKKFVDRGDPYVEQTLETAKLAADGRDYYVSFQSRTGPVEWVGPDTIDETRRLLDETGGNLFIVPISFVCDHIETLYEIDIQLKQFVSAEDSDRLKRMPMFNDDLEFGKVLANLVSREVKVSVFN